MTGEEQELMRALQAECERTYEIAQRLDAFNPTLLGAFTGTPSERIDRQLRAQGIAGFAAKEAA